MNAEQQSILEFRRYESDALKPSAFEKWAARVEKIVGHNLDGDQSNDGYSLDFALEMFNRGMSVKDYAASIS